MAVVEIIRSHQPRARIIGDAMAEGAKKRGYAVQNTSEPQWSGARGDFCIFYGFYGKMMDAFRQYRQEGKSCVCVDLGYWGRTEGGKLYGYHKVAVNSRHPTAYFQNRPKASDRFSRHGVPILPWRTRGSHIVVAGMGAKAAAFEGFKPNQWEEAAVRVLRQHTDRPILYRPKPSWRAAVPIEGTIFDHSGNEQLEGALKDCHAVVSHHSNVCVDAILAGLPAFCWHGVASPLSLKDLSLIETPLYPEDREQWAWDIAYTQWRPTEMATGECLAYLKEEGLIP